MTTHELTGILETATKLFDNARTASKMGDWARYFHLMDEAEGALLYLQLKVADASVCNCMRQLKSTLEQHRELTIQLITETTPGGDA